jgi:hypothetical protein
MQHASCRGGQSHRPERCRPATLEPNRVVELSHRSAALRDPWASTLFACAAKFVGCGMGLTIRRDLGTMVMCSAVAAQSRKPRSARPRTERSPRTGAGADAFLGRLRYCLGRRRFPARNRYTGSISPSSASRSYAREFFAARCSPTAPASASASHSKGSALVRWSYWNPNGSLRCRARRART